MPVVVGDLLAEKLELELTHLNEGTGLNTPLTQKEISRPGLALSGFFDHFANDRLQVFGNGEWALLKSFDEAALEKSLSDFFHFEIPVLVFTYDHLPPGMLVEQATRHKTAVFSSKLSTNRFIQAYTGYLDRQLAPRTTLHGVLIEVLGVGVLLIGKSGVGKSETALELVERGHRLVADDIVEILCFGGQRLYGYVSEVIEHHMEIRGLGIINIKDLFGAGSVRKSKRIDLVIQLEDWQPGKEYDRLGLQEKTYEIHNLKVDTMTIPVKPGRNVPILVETAAKNYRLKKMGVHAARAFNERLLNIMASEVGEKAKDD